MDGENKTREQRGPGPGPSWAPASLLLLAFLRPETDFSGGGPGREALGHIPMSGFLSARNPHLPRGSGRFYTQAELSLGSEATPESHAWSLCHLELPSMAFLL